MHVIVDALAYIASKGNSGKQQNQPCQEPSISVSDSAGPSSGEKRRMMEPQYGHDNNAEGGLGDLPDRKRAASNALIGVRYLHGSSTARDVPTGASNAAAGAHPDPRDPSSAGGLVAFCDGSALGNGMSGCRAG